mmetsp:Transcript_68123/g.152062  ORF Transcript_68123/g.152062 Transcript_68123/m.152062 type:complete len:214 (+) Transcript_68123:167-808(+)
MGAHINLNTTLLTCFTELLPAVRGLWMGHFTALLAQPCGELVAAVPPAELVERKQGARVQPQALSLHRGVQLQRTLERERVVHVDFASLQRHGEMSNIRPQASLLHALQQAEDARRVAGAALHRHQMGESVRGWRGEGGEMIRALLHLQEDALRPVGIAGDCERLDERRVRDDIWLEVGGKHLSKRTFSSGNISGTGADVNQSIVSGAIGGDP